MRLSPFINVLVLCLGLLCGCKDVGCDGHARTALGQDRDMYQALQTAWPKYAANSVCSHSARGLAQWDSSSDAIVSVPDGFHALIQAGAGVFLLRKDADGAYYRWNAVNKSEPQRWKYYFPEGWNVRSSYFIALSSENGKRYAFAVGLDPIPNSEGAMAISPCGAYKGCQYYGVWKGAAGGQRFYYAWPENDSRDPLSNGTETFGGGSVVSRDGRLVVLRPTGPMPVDEFWRTEEGKR